MRDLFSNPLVFLHYLRRRRRAVAQTSAIKVDDELDPLGLYFKHNDYLQAALRISSDEPTMWRGYKEPIDQYYHALLLEGTATRPGQKLPPILQQVLDRLVVQHDRGRAPWPSPTISHITFKRAGRENGRPGLKNSSGDIDSILPGISAKFHAAEK